MTITCYTIQNFNIIITLDDTSIKVNIDDKNIDRMYENTITTQDMSTIKIKKLATFIDKSLKNEGYNSFTITPNYNEELSLNVLHLKISYKNDFDNYKENLILKEIISLDNQSQLQIKRLEQHIQELQQSVQQIKKVNDNNNKYIVTLEKKLKEYEDNEENLKIRQKILQDTEIETYKRIKNLEQKLVLKEQETERKIVEETKKFTEEFKLREQQIETRWLSLINQEQNNTLPKVAEKDQKFMENIEKCMSFGKGFKVILNDITYQGKDTQDLIKKLQDTMNSVMIDDKEYIVKILIRGGMKTGYITNYGKVFQQFYYSPNNYILYWYNDFKIKNMNINLVELLEEASNNMTYGNSSTNFFGPPTIMKCSNTIQCSIPNIYQCPIW